jgi:hypothetical protein
MLTRRVRLLLEYYDCISLRRFHLNHKIPLTSLDNSLAAHPYVNEEKDNQNLRLAKRRKLRHDNDRCRTT